MVWSVLIMRKDIIYVKPLQICCNGEAVRIVGVFTISRGIQKSNDNDKRVIIKLNMSVWTSTVIRRREDFADAAWGGTCSKGTAGGPVLEVYVSWKYLCRSTALVTLVQFNCTWAYTTKKAISKRMSIWAIAADPSHNSSTSCTGIYWGLLHVLLVILNIVLDMILGIRDNPSLANDQVCQ